ncbi:MAG: PIN domain-containing protein [Luteolibacter sp.]
MNTGVENNGQAPRTQYVFVDCENVTDVPKTLLEMKPIQVILVTGRTQKSLSLPLSKNLACYGIIPSYAKSTVHGKNALDFILSFLVGRRTVEDPHAGFHIVSNDHGYDSLIAHLRSQRFDAHRHECPTGPAVVAKQATPVTIAPLADTNTRSARVRKILGKIAIKSRPGKRKTLISYIKNFFEKKLRDGQAEAILERLIHDRFLTTTDSGAVKHTTAKLTAA